MPRRAAARDNHHDVVNDDDGPTGDDHHVLSLNHLVVYTADNGHRPDQFDDARTLRVDDDLAHVSDVDLLDDLPADDHPL